MQKTGNPQKAAETGKSRKMWKNTGKVQNIFEYFIEFSRLSKLFANFGHQSVHKAQQGTLKTELIYMCILINFQLDVTLGTINISHFHQN